MSFLSLKYALTLFFAVDAAVVALPVAYSPEGIAWAIDLRIEEPQTPPPRIETSKAMTRHIAYLLLDKVPSLDRAAIVDAIKARHPDIRVEALSDAARPGGLPDGAFVLRCGSDLVVVMPMPIPVPKEEWERPSLRAKMTWPEAPAVFAGHRAHLVISTLAEPSDRLQTARNLTAVTGGLIATLPGSRAVLWDSLVAHRPEFWREASREAFAPYPMFPYPLWVSLHPFADNGKIGVITFGLSAFAGREIELDPQNAALADVTHRAAGLAVYVMQNGAVIKDGDTYGTTAADRTRIRYDVSKRVPGLAVLHAIAEAP